MDNHSGQSDLDNSVWNVSSDSSLDFYETNFDFKEDSEILSDPIDSNYPSSSYSKYFILILFKKVNCVNCVNCSFKVTRLSHKTPEKEMKPKAAQAAAQAAAALFYLSKQRQHQHRARKLIVRRLMTRFKGQ